MSMFGYNDNPVKQESIWIEDSTILVRKFSFVDLVGATGDPVGHILRFLYPIHMLTGRSALDTIDSGSYRVIGWPLQPSANGSYDYALDKQTAFVMVNGSTYAYRTLFDEVVSDMLDYKDPDFTARLLSHQYDSPADFIKKRLLGENVSFAIDSRDGTYKRVSDIPEQRYVSGLRSFRVTEKSEQVILDQLNRNISGIAKKGQQ